MIVSLLGPASQVSLITKFVMFSLPLRDLPLSWTVDLLFVHGHKIGHKIVHGEESRSKPRVVVGL